MKPPVSVNEEIRTLTEEALAAHMDGCRNQAGKAVQAIRRLERREAEQGLDKLLGHSRDFFSLLSRSEAEVLTMLKMVYPEGGVL